MTCFVEMFVIVFAGFMKSIVKEGWVPALLPQERLCDLSSARTAGSSTPLPSLCKYENTLLEEKVK